MAVPQFIDQTYNLPSDYSEAIAADVAGIITTIRSKLVTTPVSAVWTEPSAGLFKSKVDANGHFIDVLLTRIDADTLEWRVRDKDANVICTRRIDIEAAGNTTVEYYWGNYHLVVIARRAAAEAAQAFLLDPTATGDDLSAVGNRAVGAGYRSTGGVTDTHSVTVGNYFAWDNGASAQFYRAHYWGFEGASASSATATARSLISGTGRLLNFPAYLYVNQSGNRRITGALPCCLMVDSSLAIDTVRNGPLDGSITRKMIVLPQNVLQVQRMAIRKPSLDS